MKNPIFSFLIVTVLLSLVHSDEHIYEGKIKLIKSGQIASMRPLSEEPKVANIQNSIVEFVIISQQDSCKKLDNSIFERNYDEPPVFAVINFVWVEQTCGMMNKMKNLKLSGAYGLIIVNEDQAFGKNHCPMFDDNKFFIGIMNSENYKILSKEKQALKEDKIYGKLSISLKDSNLKLLEFWTSSLNRQSYNQAALLGSLFNKFPSIKESVTWKPRIALLGCNDGNYANICSQQNHVSSCACRGQFCSPEIHQKTPSIIVRQDIRQIMIYRNHATKYFQYMAAFLNNCFDNYKKHNFIEECATSIMTRIGIDSQTINKQIDDLTSKCAGELVQEDYIKNSQLYQNMKVDKRAFANYGRYPLILVNKQIIDYKSEDDLAGQLCKKLELKDSTCFEVTQTTFIQNFVSNMFYILIVVTLLVVGAAVVYFYRKKLKRDMSKEIKMQVSTAVDHYYALAQVK